VRSVCAVPGDPGREPGRLARLGWTLLETGTDTDGAGEFISRTRSVPTVKVRNAPRSPRRWDAGPPIVRGSRALVCSRYVPKGVILGGGFYDGTRFISFVREDA